MSDVEKLFVKLHERNKSILEQVRQRTESYCQHLASKLLIAGFNPPSWLLDPDSASGFEELNKEDLISKLVRPHPQPSASCSVVHYPGYGKLVINGDNGEFSDEDFVENPAFNKNLERKNDPTAPGFSGQEHGECVLNMVPELDASVASPEDQADERIIKLYTAPDQFLARIQRSKSRQKALELRSSAKAPAKSGLRHESTSDVVSSQIRFSLSNTSQPCQNDELSQLAETCAIGSQSCENRNVVEAHRLSRKTGVDTYSERNTRSESHAEVPISFPLGCSSENYKENASSQDARARRTGSMPISDSEHADNHVNRSPKSAGPSANSCESFRDRRVVDADFLCKDEETNVYTGEITRLEISRKQQSCGRDSTKADSSSNDYPGIDITMMDSGDDPPPDFVVGSLVKVNLSNVRNEGCDAQESGLEDFRRHKERDTFPSLSSIQHNAFIDDISHLEVPYASAKVHGGILAPSSAGSARQVNDSQELSGLVKPSAGLFRRVTRSQSRSYDKETYQPVTYNENPSFEDTKSISDCEEKSAEKLQNTSSGQSVSPCLGTHNMLQVVNLFAPSSAGSARQVNDLQELSGLVKPSAGLFRRVTRSQSRSYDNETYQPVTYNENPSFEGTKSISDCEEKSAEKLQNTASGQSVSPCLGTHNMLRDDKNGKLVMASELVLLDLVDHYCLSSSNNSKQIRGLESELEFKETEEFNLKASTSRSGKKSLDNLLQKMSCSLHVPDVSLNKGICVENNQPSSSKQLLRMSDVSSKEEEAHRDSCDPDAQESPDTRAENFGPVIGSAILNAFGDCAEAELTCRSSEVQDKADNLPSKMADITDIQNPLVKLHVKHGLESSPVHCMEQGEFSDEGRDKGQLVPSVSESKNLRLSYGHSSANDPVAKSYDCSIKKVGTTPIAINETKQYLAHQSPILSWPDGEVFSEHGNSSLENNRSGRLGTVWLHGKNSSLERRFTHARIESWPQVKRRKVEHQQAHFTTSQSFRVTKPRSFEKDIGNTYLKTMEIDADTELVDHANNIMDDGTCSEVKTNQIEGIQPAILSQHGEVGPCYIDARTSGDQQHIQHLCNIENNADNLNTENLNLSSTLHKEIQQSAKWEDGLHIQHSVLPSSNGDLQFTDVDQSMPEFEGFGVNAETDTGELDFAADGFLSELELPGTTLDRASFLVEICRSASSDRLSSHFSSAFKFEIQNLCKSVSDDGHLKVMEFGNIDPLNSDVGVHFQSHSSSSDDYKDSLDGMPYSVSLACSGERYGWNSRNHPSSPVGKLWDQLSSHSGSSGKASSSNPELTCFPIEEDPSSSEDNKTMEDDAGDTQGEIDSSLANHCDKRQPLEDLTNMGKNYSTSVSAEEETLRADSVDYMSSKFSVTGTEDKALLGPNQTDGRKHQLSSIGPNAFKKAKESVNNSTCKSINNSISKPVVSNKTSLKGRDQKLSLKESRRNNIVSNVSSFIPLIKQKQAAPSCTGKRDVKVKALEAAEAAKRLEEKKENERKIRKEALKLERAKMEEKNLRHMELEKKRKEEERKKKDADIIAKKRLREEEERKEKRKKRMRLEARQQQREQEEKKRAERPEKENQRTKDDQMNSKKEFNNESKRQQNRQTTRGEDMALQKTQINLTLNEVVMNYEECGTSGLYCEAGEVMRVVDKSPRKEDLLVQNSRGNSYEISPYQCSDDEDENDDQLRTKKYVPSWASKSSVALVLPLQLELDPDVVFPTDSCCSIDEVLLPRKLQQKRVAA